MSQDKEGDRSVIWSQRGAVRESNMSISDLNHLYMDTSFSGSPKQCDPETCELMAKTLEFKKTIGLVESNTVRRATHYLSSMQLRMVLMRTVQIFDGCGWEWMEWSIS